MLTQLINARILTPQGWLKDGSVLIRDGKWNDRRHFPYNRQNPYEIWDDQYFLINLQQYADEHCFSYIC